MCLTKRSTSHKYQKNLGEYLKLKNLGQYKLMKKFVNYINEMAFILSRSDVDLLDSILR